MKAASMRERLFNAVMEAAWWAWHSDAVRSIAVGLAVFATIILVIALCCVSKLALGTVVVLIMLALLCCAAYMLGSCIRGTL